MVRDGGNSSPVHYFFCEKQKWRGWENDILHNVGGMLGGGGQSSNMFKWVVTGKYTA